MKVWQDRSKIDGITEVFIPSDSSYTKSKIRKAYVKIHIIDEKYVATLLKEQSSLHPYPCKISTIGKVHTIVITGKRKTLRALKALQNLPYPPEDCDPTTFQRLKTYQQQLEDNIKSQKPKPLPAKHKKMINYQTIHTIKGKHFHNTELVSRVKRGKTKKYFLKHYDQDTACAEIEAFHAELYRLLLGTKHSPKVRVIVDSNGRRCRIRSKEVPGFTSLASIYIKQRILPPLNFMINAGCLEILAAAYLLAEDDLHASNWGFDKDNNAVKIDHDGTAYPLSYVFQNSNKKEIDKERSAPVHLSFPLTKTDMESFPFIQDASPDNYPLSPNAVEYKIFQEVFSDVKKNPEANYRIFKFFLKASLMPKDVIERYAKQHIRSSKKRKSYVDFHYHRFSKIAKLLPTITGFDDFLKSNPQLLLSITHELEIYNSHLKERDKHLQVNIESIKKAFKQNYSKYMPSQETMDLARREMLHAITLATERADIIQSKLRLLDNQVDELSSNQQHASVIKARLNTVLDARKKLTAYYRQIQQWPKQDSTPPCVLARDLQSFNATLDHMEIDIHNLPIINEALRIYKRIELVERYVNLCEHKELTEPKKRIKRCCITIEDVMTLLNNPDTKTTAKLPNHISTKLQAIESELTGASLLLQRSRFSTNKLINKRKVNILDNTIKGINKFNAASWNKLHTEYPGTFFAQTKEKAYLRDVIKDYELKIKELTQQLTTAPKNRPDKTRLERWQLRILQYIRNYYKPLGLKVSSRRLIDLADIFKIVTSATNLMQLRTDLKERARKIETGWLFRSKLRSHINKSLEVPVPKHSR